MFDALSARFAKTFGGLRAKGKISSSDIESVIEEIRSALLEADVAQEVIDLFTDRIHTQAVALLPTFQAGSNQAQAIFDVVNSELVSILGSEARRIRFAKNPPTVLMLAGLQGAGKTTLAAKLAKFYKDQGNTPLLVAADLQRPNAVTQLQVLGQQIDVPVFAPEQGNGSGSPVQVARDGIAFAQSKLYNMVIVDTAGRLGVDDELMDEAIAIRNQIKPDEILFVIDAMIGQSAINTARAFEQGVGFDGLV
jgi:signal recognition particle subunit SRP54